MVKVYHSHNLHEGNISQRAIMLTHKTNKLFIRNENIPNYLLTPSYLWEGGGKTELQIFVSNFLSLPMFSYEHHYFNIIKAMNITVRSGFESGLYYLLGYDSMTFGKS